jgi:hypothetical protein
MQGVDELNAFKRVWSPLRRRGARPKRFIANYSVFNTNLILPPSVSPVPPVQQSKPPERKAGTAQTPQVLTRRLSTYRPARPPAESEKPNKKTTRVRLVWGGSGLLLLSLRSWEPPQ